MGEIVAFIVQWVVVPCIMLALLIFAKVIVGSVHDQQARVSARAGFWAGLIVFVTYVVSQLNAIQTPHFDFFELPGLLIAPIVFGLIVGFLFLWLLRIALPTRLVGFITLLLSATSTSALFSYVFINYLRVTVLYWTLGTALGILLHIVLFPTSVRDLFD
ncbi:MAG: hypothetical protein KatS3mg100_744 [Candidatus Parcubacteria bacterium]|nr:MAG: hypothetical protein KatS3mg100_744 [Candidatus Parcubacteria bacterium]